MLPENKVPAHLDEAVCRVLYHRLLDRWNERDGRGMADLFADDGSVVGFDGSQLDGRAAIEAEMLRIFQHHTPAAFVGIVREVRQLTDDVELLRAVAGMVPPGANDINPAVNAIQSLIAVRRDGEWKLALFQNTPAQFHGRPELVESLTADLRSELKTLQRIDDE
ncbi:hypothetical protein Pan44_36630 [Caulifigura coniformis]|uniref:DUF4440 domain-containing protein n=1 Tax=Caulifigura coniformis TaxID=2527983 RepID=A0A517SHP6_9PLAN|nr:SgcJ/EcaC family oxidoreductase [Caulifigura coniformis]QDT55617.1 hypothetical protein Pan44_36630 [Caulifigura coniformis]